MIDARKDKKTWMREAIAMGGTATDMCRSLKCRYRNSSGEECYGCPSAFRKLPGWPEEEYLKTPIFGRGNA
jgi:hypothetical protein